MIKINGKKLFQQSLITVILFLALFIGSSFFKGTGLATMCLTIQYYGFPLNWAAYSCDYGDCMDHRQAATCILQPSIMPLLIDLGICLIVSLLVVAICGMLKKRLTNHKIK